MQQFSTISELKSKVEALLATQEGLCIHGFGVVGEGIMAIADRDRQFEIERAALLSPDSLRAIAFVEHWIDRRLMRDGKRINRRHTSMALKHLAEGEIGYITNGQFIVAMLLCRYAMYRNEDHVFFNVWEDGVRILAQATAEPLERVIRQMAPATGWVARCWVEEEYRWIEAPLAAWAVVDDMVVGLIAETSDEGTSALILVDELSNFRGYQYRGEA